jgi:hypothetical protein
MVEETTHEVLGPLDLLERRHVLVAYAFHE